MKTKIAIMMYYMECGGVENALVSLLRALDPQKYEVHLYVLERRGLFLDRIPNYVQQRVLPLTELERRFAVELSVRDMLRFGFQKKQYSRAIWMAAEYAVRKLFGSNAPAYETVLRRVPKEKYDIALDFHGYMSLSMVFLVRKIQAKKKYTWVHSEGFIPNVRRMQAYYRKYDGILCVSDKCRELMQEEFPEYGQRISVFHNLLDVEEIRRKAREGPPVEIPPGVLKLVTVGRLSKEKGYDIALDAAKQLKDRGISFCWLFCGEGEERPWIERRIEELGLQQETKMMGYCDNPYGYMASCDIYVQPSRYEGYAVTVTEAAALGCVVVSTDVSGAREEINTGENGIITNIDHREIAEAIERLAIDTALLAQMRHRANRSDTAGEGLLKLEKLLEA